MVELARDLGFDISVEWFKISVNLWRWLS